MVASWTARMGSRPRAIALRTTASTSPSDHEVAAGAVVDDEEAARGRAVGDQRQQLGQVLLGRALADHEVHAASQLLASFLERRRLVVGVRAGGEVGVERLAAEAGGVAVDGAVARGGELVEDARLRLDDAGEVHHLAQADGALELQGLSISSGPRVAPAVSSVVAGTQEGAMRWSSSGRRGGGAKDRADARAARRRWRSRAGR